MKLAISSTGPRFDALMDLRFGRCAHFIFVDTETNEWKAFANLSVDSRGGAGSQTAQFVANHGAQAVISGHFGPNAYKALQAAGVQMFTANGGRVETLVEDFSAGRLRRISE